MNPRFERILIITVGIIGIFSFSMAYSYATDDHERHVCFGAIWIILAGVGVQVIRSIENE
jgi:hypothetical protein